MVRCILLLLFLSSAVLASPLPDQAHIYVEGSASIEVVPDTITFSISISHTAKNVAEAKKIVDSRSRVLIGACRKLGLSDKSIATTALHVRPAEEYINGKRELVGTEVSRQVDITLKDLKKYSDVMAALVAANISRTIDTRLSLSNEAEVTDKALTKAVNDAKQRAQSLAKAQGRKLGQVHSVSEFRDRYVEVHQLQVSRKIKGKSAAGGMLEVAHSAYSEPFEPGVIEAVAKVYVVYLIE